MDNHPIPQDITGFQFKLIGDMTVKQFAYLASGCILAWICYSIALPVLAKFPLILFFAGTGTAFAFLPIAGRPMDTMLFNFTKAMFIPNQYLYQKVGGSLSLPLPKSKKHKDEASGPSSSKKLELFINRLPKRPKNKLDEKEMVFFDSLSQIFSSHSQPLETPPTRPPHLITAEEEKEIQPQLQETFDQGGEAVLEQEALQLQKELEKAKEQEQHETPDHQTQAHDKVLELEQQLADIMAQKQSLEQQLFTMSQKLSQKNQPVFTPSTSLDPLKESPNVRTVTKSSAAGVGLPIMPEAPNLVVGIVKDPRGNVLPNILVEVKDTEGNPVRAFKTNQLGQFASATSLLSGVYTITFEDPQGNHTFDTVQIQAEGEVIAPLEIISTDAREELRKQLFG